MIIGLARALERDARQRAEIGRERRREHRVALDHAGIAIGGLLAHAGAIDQRHAQAALGEMQRDRGADNAGAEHDGVRACHVTVFPFRTRSSAFIWNRSALRRYDRPRRAGDFPHADSEAPAAALAWLGRQGTRALAASVFVGLAVPPLAAYVKPYLGETVFVLLLFSYLRTDPAAFAAT